MKTTIGGDRLGSGSKSEVSARNYERSTHDLSYKWRSSMGAGTLVPFMSELALPGDTWDIDLNCDVKTLPTVGPLFGSYKVQLDIFECPIRLYQGKLHMNMINIGMDMSTIKLPQFDMVGEYDPSKIATEGDNMFTNPSSIYAYLNVRGIGRSAGGGRRNLKRGFNAVPLLSYWEIYKNYYANLQEERGDEAEGVVVHQNLTDNNYEALTGTTLGNSQNLFLNGVAQGNPYDGVISLTGITAGDGIGLQAVYYWPHQGTPEGAPNINDIKLLVNGTATNITNLFTNVSILSTGTYFIQLECSMYTGPLGNVTFNGVGYEEIQNTVSPGDGLPRLVRFPLNNIDEMREEILQNVANPYAVVVDYQTQPPYGLGLNTAAGVGSGDWTKPYAKSNQEGLAIKTYQSDLFNNWISTRWIDGPNGVGEVSAVVVQQNQAGTDNVVYMDSLNLQQKVYNMLNRIAVSGGTYDDWLDAVYTHERAKSIESPVYHGSLIKSLAFEEVISQADTSINGNKQPLGTLAGRGRLTGKHKGGKVKIKVSEPSYIMGIISITPGASGLDYSQGNKWDMNLKTMDDFYKPELGQIGYEELVTGQMHWAGDEVDSVTGEVQHYSAGKQPAWINYMTNVNRTRGNFAIGSAEEGPVGEMFMTLNRRYEFDNNGITDLTTYIDPSKFNNIFALTDSSAQNFWVQVGNKITCRRKMSAKTIPNL